MGCPAGRNLKKNLIKWTTKKFGRRFFKNFKKIFLGF